MDNTQKPKGTNPRLSAGLLSQLLLAWSVRLLYRGSKEGLTSDDLTNCLEEDRSEELGDKLEKAWNRELASAQRKQRKPLLRRAMLCVFWRSAMLDGFISVIYIVIKSLIPAILAQLLIQFQAHPIAIKNMDDDLAVSNRTIRAINTVASEAPLNNIDGDIKLNPSVSATSENTTNSEPITPSTYAVVLQVMWTDTYWLGTLLALSTLVGCFLLHHVDLRQRLLGARMRIACCSAIYRKTLRLSMKTAGQTPAGYLINLLSNDVNRLDFGFVFAHWIWILPLQSVLICYLIWLRIGVAALIGVVCLLLKTIPVQTALSKLASKLRMRIAERTDLRVRSVAELVQGIQVIKMYAWEKPFQAVVAEARRREIKQIRYASYLRGFYLSTMVFTERSTLYVTIAAALLLGNAISADIVFSAAGYFNILQLVAAIWYPLAVSCGAEALVSLKRVEAFLLLEEQDEKAQGITHKKEIAENTHDSQPVLLLKDVSASWDTSKSQPTLQNINLEVQRGQLCAVIGAVGAGKSSLFQLLLGELPISQGNAIIQGECSYAAQDAWLFTGTVRNNIIFGEVYDRKRYQEVTRCCALTTDFQQLKHGDKTIVGERGASLSGGQRARISLARAVYKRASVYLLDDPLSAVDAHVGRHLFDEVIGPRGRLAVSEKATVLLITHQVHFLTEADMIVVVKNGRICRQGTYAELAQTDVDFAKLLERQNVTSQDESEHDSSTHDSSLEDDDIPYIDGVAGDGYQAVRQNSTSRGASLARKSVSSERDLEEEDDHAMAEVQGHGSMGWVWWEYFHAGSTLCGLSFMAFVMLLSQAACSGSDFFVNIWTQQEYLRSQDEPTVLTTYECLYIYGALIIAVGVMCLFRGYLFFTVCMHASKVLHDRMFACILRATMRFFDTNPSGRILNRFSKDMGAIDEYMPRAMMDVLQIALVMFGILIVIVIVNPILLVAMVVVGLIDGFVLKLYMRPSQDLKRLEGICRSPVFSHMSATLSGIATIRHRHLQGVVAKEFDSLQNVHSAVWQLTMCANTTLGLWLDCVSCVFLTAVTFSFIVLNQQTFSGNVGLAISQAMVLTGMVQYGVRQVAESMQQMTSVERVLQYTDLEQESSIAKQPPASWPTHGHIEFKSLSCRYDPNGSAVLRNLNLVIEPGWKVGIVGRTGAGKSSLISCLFRLAHLEGEIIIDGIETGSISLQCLRSQISIIPQAPILFSATIRYNLDPFEKYSDAELWRALEDVELKGAIPGLDFMVTEGGSNFSVGQRQLICLARAILRNNQILVLDEATANVDPQTDALIQQAIRLKFKHCTVLTVAHRLHTVMDSDRVLVMDAGISREFDIPHVLLKKPQGALRQMVDATGSESEALKKIASDTYYAKRQALKEE